MSVIQVGFVRSKPGVGRPEHCESLGKAGSYTFQKFWSLHKDGRNSMPGRWTSVGRSISQSTESSGTAAHNRPLEDQKKDEKHATLYDVPVSNNGARIRFLIYKKGLNVHITPPADIGGLKSLEYLDLNPYGKMPLFVLEDGTALYESQVIESYILDKYKDFGPSLIPETPELRARAALAARIHDIYIASVQGCLYKDMVSPEERFMELKKIAFSLDVLENIVEGPFICGGTMSFGDSALFPTFVFLTYILPRHFGWKSVFTGRPKLREWWDAICADPDAAKVIKEIQDGLEAWDADDRWEKKGITGHVEDQSFDWSCGC